MDLELHDRSRFDSFSSLPLGLYIVLTLLSSLSSCICIDWLEVLSCVCYLWLHKRIHCMVLVPRDKGNLQLYSLLTYRLTEFRAL